jgi:hypothetical protein
MTAPGIINLSDLTFVMMMPTMRPTMIIANPLSICNNPVLAISIPRPNGSRACHNIDKA